MAEDPKWELAIVETVYGFYRKLLHDCVQEPVPLPSDLHLRSLGELDQIFPDPLARIRGWLKLFDLAVTPSMLRQTLTPGVEPEIAETLLRYYARKKASSDVDRDKADFVATFLYRNPRVPGQWEKRGYTLDGAVPTPPFEIALIEILAEAEAPEMPEDCVPVLREFDSLREKIESYTTLEALTDSGVVQKGRDLKQALGTCFYHPGVLATIGPYNTAVGKRLEDLFRNTAKQLKSFAESVRSEGGDLSSSVEGEVTVGHLTLIEESEILKAEYATAQEKFRRVSKVKRAVDLRNAGKKDEHLAHRDQQEEDAVETRVPKAKAAAAATSESLSVVRAPSPRVGAEDENWDAPEVAEPHRPLWAPKSSQSEESAQGPPSGLPARGFLSRPPAPEPTKFYDAGVELGKLKSVNESIRVFVRAADAKSRQVVPMRFFNLTLTAAEADACGAEYWDEKSFRGEYARALTRIVALVARISTEAEELRQRKNSSHLWKPHAASLRFLLDTSAAAFEESNTVLALAGQRGLNEKINAMRESLQKLQTRMSASEEVLTELGDRDPSSNSR